MEGLDRYLQKIRDLVSSSGNDKDALKQAVREILNVELKDSEIKKKNNIFTLSISPTFKTEIALKKEKIIFRVEQLIGKKIYIN